MTITAAIRLAARIKAWRARARLRRAQQALLRDIEALDRATLNDMGVTRPELISRAMRALGQSRTCHG